MITLSQMRTIAFVGCAALLSCMSMAPSANAQATTPPHAAALELARKRACLACHQVEQPRAGPAFLAVAKKHQGDKQAEARLVQKVLKGGGGVWKMPMGPMPAQSQVNEAEARLLVRWILTLR